MSGSSPAAVLLTRGVLAFAMLAIGPVVAFDLWPAMGGELPVPASAAWVEASMAAFLGTALLLLAFARWQPVAWPWSPWWWRPVLAGYGPFALGWVALTVGYLALMRSLGQPVEAQTALRYLAAGEFDRPGYWLVALGVVVAAPLAEEIVFRGYLQGALHRVLSPRAAILLVAALFGLAHGLQYALPTGLLGAWFGWLAWRRGSLLPAIAGHVLHNGLMVALVALWPRCLELLYPR
jgi:hypothetical protein